MIEREGFDMRDVDKRASHHVFTRIKGKKVVGSGGKHKKRRNRGRTGVMIKSELKARNRRRDE